MNFEKKQKKPTYIGEMEDRVREANIFLMVALQAPMSDRKIYLHLCGQLTLILAMQTNLMIFFQ